MSMIDDEIRNRAEQLDNLVERVGDAKPWLLVTAAFFAGGFVVWLIGWAI